MSVTSRATDSTRSPRSAAARRPAARSRLPSTTESPRAAHCRATSRPSPRLAPVTTTTLPLARASGHVVILGSPCLCASRSRRAPRQAPPTRRPTSSEGLLHPVPVPPRRDRRDNWTTSSADSAVSATVQAPGRARRRRRGSSRTLRSAPRRQAARRRAARCGGSSARAKERTRKAAASGAGSSRRVNARRVGRRSVIRSTRNVRQSARSGSKATKYQRPPWATRWCGSTRRRVVSSARLR